ncbi:hypothetical protein CRYUN_Cryun09bG0158800 [Craigia yunnanensis]
MMLVVNVKKNYSKKNKQRGACSKGLRGTKPPTSIGPRRGESSQRKTRKRRLVNKKMVAKLMQLKVEMKEISEEQGSIKEGQRQVKEKFEVIESECKNLRQETMIIMQQSACTRLRLAFMFQILKARESNDFAKAAELTHALRELIAQPNQIVQAFGTKCCDKGEINGK